MQSDLFIQDGEGGLPNGAKFSPNNKRRYCLWRIWDDTLPYIAFIGLNPSTANQNDDDPTIRRVKRFAFDWGYGGVYMLNCFSQVTPYPSALKAESNDKENDRWIREIGDSCEKIVFAWGNFTVVNHFGRDVELSAMFPDAVALRLNSNGSPAHPLYIPANVTPIKYKL